MTHFYKYVKLGIIVPFFLLSAISLSYGQESPDSTSKQVAPEPTPFQETPQPPVKQETSEPVKQDTQNPPGKQETLIKGKLSDEQTGEEIDWCFCIH